MGVLLMLRTPRVVGIFAVALDCARKYSGRACGEEDENSYQTNNLQTVETYTYKDTPRTKT